MLNIIIEILFYSAKKFKSETSWMIGSFFAEDVIGFMQVKILN